MVLRQKTVTKVLLPIEVHVILIGLQATHKSTLLLYFLSPLCPFPAMMSFAGYFHVRFFCPLSLFWFPLFWLGSVCFVTTAGFVADRLM